jgi:hypothetical protein
MRISIKMQSVIAVNPCIFPLIGDAIDSSLLLNTFLCQLYVL